MCLNIQENAIFVADAHYNENRNEFLVFLEKLKNSSVQTTQLFLMGDMFDFISGESKYFIKRNEKVIQLINELAKTLQIIYFEGNHDYNLKIIFPNVSVIPREKQPLCAKYGDTKVSLAHGDIYVGDKFYDIYCSVIRNPYLLKFLNVIDFNNAISKKIYYTLIKKNICARIGNFEDIVKKRVSFYEPGLIIEGHFHQGNEYVMGEKRYMNIPSLSCSKTYCVLKDNCFIGVKVYDD